MASPLRRSHGRRHSQLGSILQRYSEETQGVETLDNVTTILGEESEPQPDLALRILSEYGGQSRETADDYVEGPPELVAEVAHSTRAIDLHQKRLDYQQAGVREYLVLCIEGPELIWFGFRSRGRIVPDGDGVCRSRVFPGLWIDAPALLAGVGARQARCSARVFRRPNILPSSVGSNADMRNCAASELNPLPFSCRRQGRLELTAGQAVPTRKHPARPEGNQAAPHGAAALDENG